jgi:hypothetical protein
MTPVAILLYLCLCHDNGRKPAPAPRWIRFEVRKGADPITEGIRQCALVNYGDASSKLISVEKCKAFN